jgi:hypothetical protein
MQYVRIIYTVRSIALYCRARVPRTLQGLVATRVEQRVAQIRPRRRTRSALRRRPRAAPDTRIRRGGAVAEAGWRSQTSGWGNSPEVGQDPEAPYGRRCADGAGISVGGARHLAGEAAMVGGSHFAQVGWRRESFFFFSEIRSTIRRYWPGPAL